MDDELLNELNGLDCERASTTLTGQVIFKELLVRSHPNPALIFPLGIFASQQMLTAAIVNA